MKIKSYLAFARKSFLSKSAYRFEHWMGIFNTVLQLFIFWGIYRALYGNRTEVDGITMTMVTTNFVLSMGLGSAFYTNDFYLPGKIWDGSIANELLLPVNFQGRMLADNLGHACFKLIFHFTPVALIGAAAMGILPPAGVKAFCLFLFSTLLGYGVLWSVSFAVQMLAFWLINIWSVVTIKNVFVNVLSGAMIPLWFMPHWMKGVMNWTPFSSIYFTPIQIYLGQISGWEIGVKCLIQMGWIVVIFALGCILWNRGQRKLVVQGG